MAKLNIGCGRNPLHGWTNLDREPGPDRVVFDLENCKSERMPFEDNTFEVIEARHVLEHIANILPVMQELHRIAKPDCILQVAVPYGSSDSAYADPTHVRFFFLDSPGYFSQAAYGGADYGYRGDWAVEGRVLAVRRDTFGQFENDLETLMGLVTSSRNVVDEFFFHMRAVKPIRQPGTFHESCPVSFYFK